MAGELMVGDATSCRETLIDVLRVGGSGRGDKPAIRALDRTLTYDELANEAARMATMLATLGVTPGDRVAYLGRSSTHFVSMLFASALSGSVLVPLNWRLSAAEIADLLDDAAPTLLVADGGLIHLLPTHLSFDVVEMKQFDPTTYDEDVLEGHVNAAAVEPDDPAWLIYTSGTTGKPKGVVLAHANTMATIDGVAAAWEITEDSVVYVPYPAFHLTGIGWVLKTLRVGGTVIQRPAVDVADLLDALDRYGVTNTLLIPTVLSTLVNFPGVTSERLASLRSVVYGVAPITEALLARATRLMPHCRFIHVYGMTESCGQATVLPWAERQATEQSALSCGRSYPWVELRVVDPVAGMDRAEGEPGEVWLRGPNVMAGYFGKPEATAAAITTDGWLKTGDGGYLDREGYLVLTDRIKDMIISGGENIYPAEVENVLARHPAVREVTVVGVPDEYWGERVRAFVVLFDGSTPDENEIISFARGQLAHYKCPSSVIFMDALPKNSTGKVLRSRLRERTSESDGQTPATTAVR